MPSSVRRTPGAIAKTIVATMPGTGPMPNKMSAGIRYTNAGVVCMKSRTGLIVRLAASDRAAQTPSGRLSTTAIPAATTTSASDSIA